MKCILRYKLGIKYSALLYLMLSTSLFFFCGSATPACAQEEEFPWEMFTPATRGMGKPSKPINPLPADGARNQATNAKCSWENGGLATSYDVYFGTNPTPSDFKGNQATTNYNPGTLRNDTTYYWRIDAVNAAGKTTGDVWEFTVLDKPSKPINPLPEDGLGDQPTNTTCSWENGGLATSYDVYFGTNPTPSDFKGNQTDTNYDPGALLDGTVYYWRIDAVNAAGKTTGDVWEFSTVFTNVIQNCCISGVCSPLSSRTCLQAGGIPINAPCDPNPCNF